MVLRIQHAITLLCSRLWVLLVVFLPFGLCAANGGFNDNIDRSDPNFVKASLLVFSPGESLYSCAGHACFRLECPKFNLDYCFSYESEPAKNRVMSFLAGDLKMGMFAIPTAEFLKQYREEGRGILQYELNLPSNAKQRLWKLLDEKVAEGAYLKYDFIERGCAQSTLKYLYEAIRPAPIAYAPWPAKYEKTLRELFEAALVENPWNLCILEALVGIDVDANLPKIRRVIIPGDLVEFLGTAKVNGAPILKGASIELLPRTRQNATTWLSPVVTAVLVVALAVANFFLRVPWLDLVFLAFQTAFGAFLAYLVFVSKLPATTWNWLIIPFNVLPAIFWRWRRMWALPFVCVLLAWEAFMLLSSHRLTDPAFYVLVAAYIVFYLKFTPLARKRFGPTAGCVSG